MWIFIVWLKKWGKYTKQLVSAFGEWSHRLAKSCNTREIYLILESFEFSHVLLTWPFTSCTSHELVAKCSVLHSSSPISALIDEYKEMIDELQSILTWNYSQKIKLKITILQRLFWILYIVYIYLCIKYEITAWAMTACYLWIVVKIIWVSMPHGGWPPYTAMLAPMSLSSSAVKRDRTFGVWLQWVNFKPIFTKGKWSHHQ